ncbi:hypothetical protein ZIOFF_072621 [Zingiber officinale]|uniref:Uncharacterized protein n=1 Tax=Zingiber officinale TaxID=94328 RepID=A0A8J5C650_ZINOF|nr:hypothetical protein ZIOFF_072621 [Zingiber officinale]
MPFFLQSTGSASSSPIWNQYRSLTSLALGRWAELRGQVARYIALNSSFSDDILALREPSAVSVFPSSNQATMVAEDSSSMGTLKVDEEELFGVESHWVKAQMACDHLPSLCYDLSQIPLPVPPDLVGVVLSRLDFNCKSTEG